MTHLLSRYQQDHEFFIVQNYEKEAFVPVDRSKFAFILIEDLLFPNSADKRIEDDAQIEESTHRNVILKSGRSIRRSDRFSYHVDSSEGYTVLQHLQIISEITLPEL